jgi:hypothetical protein
MDADVFIEVMRVFEGNCFHPFQVGGELFEFRETATPLLLNADLDFANPSAL